MATRVNRKSGIEGREAEWIRPRGGFDMRSELGKLVNWVPPWKEL